MKKKLVIISEALGGGVRRHIVDLLENLNKNKFEIYFIYNLDRADTIIKDKLKNMRLLGINLIEIEGFNREIGKNDIRAIKSIYNELKTIKPDIVHCHSSKAGALGRISAKIIGVKKIYYTPHAYYFQNPDSSNLKKKIYATIESLLSRYFTTKTINVSLGEKQIALSYNLDKERKFHVIYNGIELYKNYNSEIKLKLSKEFNIYKDDVIIGVIARLNGQKDPDTFIDIAKKVTEKYDNVKFIYVGDGSLYNKIKYRINNENLSEKVILTGFRNDTEDILEIFDIFLTTALYEGMPYALIEALRAKLPIIATNTIGNNEIVSHDINGYLIDTKDSESGLKYIEHLLNNEDMIQKLGNKSFEEYNEKFTIKDMIEKYEALYESI